MEYEKSTYIRTVRACDKAYISTIHVLSVDFVLFIELTFFIAFLTQRVNVYQDSRNSSLLILNWQ
jgi:hypothetical protein